MSSLLILSLSTSMMWSIAQERLMVVSSIVPIKCHMLFSHLRLLAASSRPVTESGYQTRSTATSPGRERVKSASKSPRRDRTKSSSLQFSANLSAGDEKTNDSGP